MKSATPIPPQSSFSAPFSKTAKETRVRICNLFHGKKHRPPMGLLLVMCGAALISGSLISCQKKTLETPLTAGELTYFNHEFFNGDTYNWNNQFLTCEYTSPEDVDLFEIFYNGMEGSSSAVSQEERQLLAQLDPFTINSDVIKVTEKEMDSILNTYLGVGLDAVREPKLPVYYLNQWDAYYWVHGDTNVQHCEVTSGTHIPEAYVELHYTKDDGTQWIVTLKQNDHGYYFQSNVEETV